MILDYPLASLGIIISEERNSHVSAIHVRQRTTDPDNATPSPGANHSANLVRLEAPREQVTVRSRIFVYKQHLRASLSTLRHGSVQRRRTRHRHPVNLTQKPLYNHRGNVSATIRTVIYDERLLVQLRVIVTHELVQALRPHVRNVDVTHLAARLLLNGLDILLNPLIMLERIFICSRRDNHLPATFGCRFINRKLAKLASFANQQLIDIVHALQRLSVNRSDIVALRNIHSWLHHWRTQLRTIRSTLIDVINLEIAALILAETRPKKTHVDALRLRVIARGDVGVAAGQLRNHATYDIVQIQASLNIRK